MLLSNPLIIKPLHQNMGLLYTRDPSPLESPGSKKGQNQRVLSLLIYILFNN